MEEVWLGGVQCGDIAMQRELEVAATLLAADDEPWDPLNSRWIRLLLLSTSCYLFSSDEDFVRAPVHRPNPEQGVTMVQGASVVRGAANPNVGPACNAAPGLAFLGLRAFPDFKPGQYLDQIAHVPKVLQANTRAIIKALSPRKPGSARAVPYGFGTNPAWDTPVLASKLQMAESREIVGALEQFSLGTIIPWACFAIGDHFTRGPDLTNCLVPVTSWRKLKVLIIEHHSLLCGKEVVARQGECPVAL